MTVANAGPVYHSANGSEPLPPWDEQAEQAVLGAMLLSRDAILDVAAILDDQDFYRPSHAAVYDAVLSLHLNGGRADAILVASELERRGELGRVGGAPYLHTLIAAVVTPANAGYYAEIVVEKARRRRWIETGQRVIQQAYGTTDLGSIATLVDTALRTARPVAATAVERCPSLNWADAFATDFSVIDWLPGRLLERGQQVSLVGDGKVGKSLFMHDWLWRAITGRGFLGDESRPPLRVLYFDRENGLRDIVTRMQSLGATPDELTGRFDYRMFPTFSGALDAAGTAADELLAIVDEVGTDVVVLDTVSRFIAGKENDADTWLQFYSRVHAPLKARGIAGIRLDHMGKDSDRGSRGSSAKSQDVDHVWELTGTDDMSTYDDGIQTVTTQLRLRRTHTRTGLGMDDFAITRRGRKGPDGAWLRGQTRHELTYGGGARSDIQVFVDKLLAARCPGNSRDEIKSNALALGIDLPRRNELLAQIVREYKAQREV